MPPEWGGRRALCHTDTCRRRGGQCPLLAASAFQSGVDETPSHYSAHQDIDLAVTVAGVKNALVGVRLTALPGKLLTVEVTFRQLNPRRPAFATTPASSTTGWAQDLTPAVTTIPRTGAPITRVG